MIGQHKQCASRSRSHFLSTNGEPPRSGRRATVFSARFSAFRPFRAFREFRAFSALGVAWAVLWHSLAWAAPAAPALVPPGIGDEVILGTVASAGPGGAVYVFVNGVLLPSPSPVAIDNTFALSVPPLEGGDLVWARAIDSAGQEGPTSDIATVLVPLPAPAITTPLLAGDTNVQGAFSCDSTAFAISQNGFGLRAYPVTTNSSIESFYGFGTSAPGSANSGLEQSGRATVVLHRNGVTGALSIAVVFDSANDGSGGTATLSVNGLPASAELMVADDPANATSAYNVAAGEFTWAWDSCCTAGLAIGPLSDDVCMDLTLSGLAGVTGLDVVHGSPDGPVRVALPTTNSTFSICGVPCTDATVTVKVGGSEVGFDESASPTWSVPVNLLEGDVVTARADHPLYGAGDSDGPYTAQVRTATPALNAPILDTATSVSGTLPGEVNGTPVTLYRNGTGTIVGTVTTSGGAFTVAVPGGSPLQPGDVLFATAQAAGKATSLTSAPVLVESVDKSAAPQVEAPLVAGDTVVCGASVEPDGTLIEVFVAGSLAGSTTTAANQWCVTLATPLLAGQTATARATAPGKAISASSPPQSVLQRTKTPTVQQPLYQGVSLVKGTVADADGTQVTLFRDGTEAATGVALDGKWSVVTTPLVAGESISARAQTAGKGQSFESPGIEVIVNVVSEPPVLVLPLIAGDVEILGSCESGEGVAILFKNGGFLGTALFTGGTWQFALPSPLSTGEIITAQCQMQGKATSPLSPEVAVLARSQAPTFDVPVYDDATTVGGSSAEPTGTAVSVYYNGSLYATTAVDAGQWTTEAPAELFAGDQLFATAKADGKAVSPPSNIVEVLFKPLSQTPTVNGPLTEGATQVSGTSSEAPGSVVIVYVDGEQAGTTTVAATGTYSASVSALQAGSEVTATVQATNEKQSLPSSAVTVLAKSATPVINAPVYSTDSQVTGSVAEISGTTVSLTRNGDPFGSTTASGGTWVLAVGAPLNVGDLLCATAKAPGKAVSAQSACVPVQQQLITSKPTIAAPVVEGALQVSGSVAEGLGTTVTLRQNGAVIGTASVTVPTQWSVQLAAPVICGATLTATAKAPTKLSGPASNPVVVQCKSTAPTLEAPIKDCDTVISGTSSEPDGAIIRLYVQGQANPVGQTVLQSNQWTIVLITPQLPGVVLYATAQSPGQAESSASNKVTVVVRPNSDAPVVATPLLQLDEVVSGTSTESDGAIVRVFVDGELVGTTVLAAGQFSIPVAPPLEYGQKITATVEADCEYESLSSEGVLVGYKDTDLDTINDVDEQVGDADGDGDDNLDDLDSDDDGIPDEVEAGDDDLGTVPIDTDGDGIPDFLDLDSDGDDKPDEEEGTGDIDGDGTPNWIDSDDNDGPLGDADGDTISNQDEGFTETNTDGDDKPDYLDLDSDGDGIPDKVEAGDTDLSTPPIDSDGDLTPDFLDEDSDGDGLLDIDEGLQDCDNDTIPNYLDLDSDNDGIPDGVEGLEDVDNDGIEDYCDPELFDPDGDDDGDTISNGDEGKGDPDGDGIPNYLDLDSDDDTIPDKDEAGDADLGTPPDDADGDGIPNFVDLDSDNDTIYDEDEMSGEYPGDVVPDADGDGVPNFLDLDSDGDGIDDEVEAGDADLDTPPVDSDGDEVPDFLDTDSDGDTISDADEMSDAYPSGLVPDADGDGTPNYLDLDSDDDGIPDNREAGDLNLDTPPIDTDGDGRPDFLDTDSDGDGVSDGVDNCVLTANPGQEDADFDGVGDLCDNCPTFPNPTQTDANADGIGDVCEGIVLGEEDDGFVGGLYGGGGCRATDDASGASNSAPWWLGLMALGWLAVRRRQRRLRPFVDSAAAGALLLAALGWHMLSAAPVAAQGLDAQRFRPAAGRGNMVVTHGSDTGQHLDYSLGLVVDYAHNPLVMVLGDRRESIVSDLVTGHFLFGLSLWDFMQIGIDVPVNLFLDGAYENRTLASATMGDIGLDFKFRVLNAERTGGFGLALIPQVRFPTGNENDFSGSGSFAGLVRLAMDYQVWRMKFALNFGYGLGKDSTIRNVTAGSELFLNAGISYNLIDPLTLTTEVYGYTSAKEPFANDAESPMELIVSLKGEIVDGVYLLGGGGAGLTVGVGSPEYRVFAGAGWAPVVRDADGDGIVDEIDQCPTVPEDFDGFEDEDGCPELDNDMDGIPDVDDVCPNEPEDKDGYQDLDGCPDIDNDGDGIADVRDKCPNNPEDFDDWEDEDGCPDPDNDGDGIPDVTDKCPLDPEVFNGVEDDDGCPDQSMIELREDYIQIKDKVYFDFDKAKIQERSFEMLNQIASLLSGRPDIGLVLVGGHTDSKGSDIYNLDLSQRRAAAVVTYLTGRGVGPDRLRAQGFGETQPVATNDTDEGREMNRRVEFLILDQGTRPSPSAP